MLQHTGIRSLFLVPSIPCAAACDKTVVDRIARTFILVVASAETIEMLFFGVSTIVAIEAKPHDEDWPHAALLISRPINSAIFGITAFPAHWMPLPSPT